MTRWGTGRTWVEHGPRHATESDDGSTVRYLLDHSRPRSRPPGPGMRHVNYMAPLRTGVVIARLVAVRRGMRPVWTLVLDCPTRCPSTEPCRSRGHAVPRRAASPGSPRSTGSSTP